GGGGGNGRGSEGGEAAEQERRGGRQADGEQQHAYVDAEIEGVRRRLIGHFQYEQARAPACEQEADARARERQQRALREQLPRDAPPRGAERDAHAQLVPPRARAREEQIRDVGARDQQDERDHGHDQVQRIAILASERVGAIGGGPQRERILQVVRQIFRAPVRRDRRLADLRLDAAQRSGGAVHRVAGLQP